MSGLKQDFKPVLKICVSALSLDALQKRANQKNLRRMQMYFCGQHPLPAPPVSLLSDIFVVPILKTLSFKNYILGLTIRKKMRQKLGFELYNCGQLF